MRQITTMNRNLWMSGLPVVGRQRTWKERWQWNGGTIFNFYFPVVVVSKRTDRQTPIGFNWLIGSARRLYVLSIADLLCPMSVKWCVCLSLVFTWHPSSSRTDDKCASERKTPFFALSCSSYWTTARSALVRDNRGFGMLIVMVIDWGWQIHLMIRLRRRQVELVNAFIKGTYL